MNLLKKNIFYNSVLTVSNFFFAFITFPYVSRVLGVANLGLCNFIDSTINYFILFSMLGISTLGIREIAKYKNDKNQLESCFRDLFFLNGILTLCAICALIVMIFFIPTFASQKRMMYIGVGKLVFNFFLVEWFFAGSENFRYITIRSLIVKIVYCASVFIFIRNRDQFVLYFALMVGSVMINAILNWHYLSSLIRVSWIRFNIKRYFKSNIILGSYVVLTSMYTTLNVLYLGFLGGNIEVGYYTTASKLYSIFLALFTAFTAVMLPRMSALIAERKIEEFKRMAKRSYDILFGFSFPAILLASVFAPQIIKIIAGPGYEGAITPMRIIMPLILIIGYEQILVIQVLMPLRKDKAVLINSIIGALFGVILDILLVGKLKSVGSAIVWLTSETAVLISAQYFVTMYVKIKFPWKLLFKTILWSVPVFLVCYIIKVKIGYMTFLSLLIALVVVFFSYLFINLKLLKNEIFIVIINKYKKKAKTVTKKG